MTLHLDDGVHLMCPWHFSTISALFLYEKENGEKGNAFKGSRIGIEAFTTNRFPPCHLESLTDSFFGKGRVDVATSLEQMNLLFALILH